jgi:hypothetical protein
LVAGGIDDPTLVGSAPEAVGVAGTDSVDGVPIDDVLTVLPADVHPVTTTSASAIAVLVPMRHCADAKII